MSNFLKNSVEFLGSFFGRLSAKKTSRRATGLLRALSPETLEVRTMLAAGFVPEPHVGVGTNYISSQALHGGETNVPLSQFSMYADQFTRLTDMSLVAAYGSASLDNLQYVDLRLDADHNGTYETHVGHGIAYDEQIYFHGGIPSPLLGRSRVLDFQVTGDLQQTLVGERIGVEFAEANFQTLSGASVPYWNVTYFGALPTMHSIVQNVAELNVVVRATATTDVAVSNQHDISLLRFEATATESGASITAAVFTAQQGNINNATNFSLWLDTTKDGVVDYLVQGGVVPVGGKVIFDNAPNGNIIIGGGSTFEVHADIASSLAGNKTLQLKFGTSSPNYLQAEDARTGASLYGIQTNGVGEGGIHVTTAPSTIFTLRTQGDLFVTKSSTPIRDMFVLGGTSEVVARLQFQAEFESIDVTTIRFAVLKSAVRNIDRFELFKVGALTPFAIATVSATGSDKVPLLYQGQAITVFTVRMTNQQFVVPKGESVGVLVRARINSDIDGAVSGDVFTPILIGTNGATVPFVEARGFTSSNNLYRNNGNAKMNGEVFIGTSNTSLGVNKDILGATETVVLSKITSVTNVDPNANGTAIPTGTQRQIGQFKVTTAAANNSRNGTNRVVVQQFTFFVNATNVAIDLDSFRVYNKEDASVKASCSVSLISGIFNVTCTIGMNSVNTEIDPGSDATFVLEANIVNPKINATLNSVLQVSLDVGPNFVWVDHDHARDTVFAGTRLPDLIINGTQYQN